jgi:hypothetical protein
LLLSQPSLQVIFSFLGLASHVLLHRHVDQLLPSLALPPPLPLLVLVLLSPFKLVVVLHVGKCGGEADVVNLGLLGGGAGGEGGRVQPKGQEEEGGRDGGLGMMRKLCRRIEKRKARKERLCRFDLIKRGRRGQSERQQKWREGINKKKNK